MTFKEFVVKEGMRLYRAGSKVLSVRELLTFLLRDPAAANKLIQKYDNLYEMATADIGQLIELLGQTRAEQVHAAMELGVRLCNTHLRDRTVVKTPADIYELCKDMRFLRQESFRVVLLDPTNQVLRVFSPFLGTVDSATVSPREVFGPALSGSATGIAVAHNHPSGDTKPSTNDTHVTKTLVRVGKLTGIDLIDHIIIGDQEWYSFRDSQSQLWDDKS